MFTHSTSTATFKDDDSIKIGKINVAFILSLLKHVTTLICLRQTVIFSL